MPKLIDKVRSDLRSGPMHSWALLVFAFVWAAFVAIGFALPALHQPLVAQVVEQPRRGRARDAQQIGHLAAQTAGRGKDNAQHETLRRRQPEAGVHGAPFALDKPRQGGRIEVKAMIEHGCY